MITWYFRELLNFSNFITQYLNKGVPFDRIRKFSKKESHSAEKNPKGGPLGFFYFCVEFLIFSAYENPLLLREVHMIDGTMLIMFLDRRNTENS